MAYTEQITFLLFLKMADEQTRPPYNRKPIVPTEFGRPACWSATVKNSNGTAARFAEARCNVCISAVNVATGT